MIETTEDKLYRYEACSYSIVIDADRDEYGSTGPKLELREYRITAKTPKGHWIGYFEGAKDRWVSKTSRKRYAYPTKEEALEGYRQKKLAFVRHAEANLSRAKEELALIDPDNSFNQLPRDRNGRL